MKRKILFLLIFFVCISSCTMSNENLHDSSECIPPINKLSEFLMKHFPNLLHYTDISPNSQWAIQGKLPFPQNDFYKLYYRPGKNELWFTTTDANAIYRYSIEKKEWFFYNEIDKNTKSPEVIFISSNGTIWGGVSKHILEDNFSILCKFNDYTNKFEFVFDKDGILKNKIYLTSNIVENPKGTLWFFADYNNSQNLYSYNTSTNEIKSKFSRSMGGNSNIFIDHNNNIVFLNKFDNEINIYNIETGIIDVLAGASSEENDNFSFDTNDSNYMYIDKQYNIWLGNTGWIESTNISEFNWNPVTDIPIFASQITDIDDGYITLPVSMFQDSEEQYWFTGFYGISKYDKKNDQWCLFTTGMSDVVEDGNHTLWIAVFDHLYSYKLE